MRLRFKSFAARLRRSCDGAAMLEFAFVAPVFITMLLGVLNIGQMVYGKVLLAGAVAEVARDATFETANTSVSDAKVKRIVEHVLVGVTVASTRKSYYDFTDISRAEKWNDKNKNGTCDNSETYTDENKSGHWDPDIGKSGNGGASDTVVYTVKATYEPLFTIPFAPDEWSTTVVEASAVKKNQPFALQAEYGSSAGSCP
jgi:Flp pilus assembly protein TadG